MLLALALVLPAHALESSDDAAIRRHVHESALPCGADRQWVIDNLDLTCRNVPFSVPDDICIGALLNACTYPDHDADGSTREVDCNDSDPAIYPGAYDAACDNIDTNCDGAEPTCDPDTVLYDTDADATVTDIWFHYCMPISEAGDMNGDGYGDAIVGSPWESLGASNSGGAYILYGPMSGTNAAPSVAATTLVGSGTNSFLGDSVAGGQDLDGDGWDDVAAGGSLVTTSSYQSGGAYVFFGPLPGSVGDSAADVYIPATGSITSPGGLIQMTPDATGDGNPDLLVSAAGGGYLLSGPGLSGGSLASAAGIVQPSGYYEWVRGVGDLNGDGVEDIGIGCGGCEATAGWVYVMYGPINGTRTIAAADVHYDGEGGYFGYGFSAAHDVSGDGLDDLAVGAWGTDTLYYSAGAVYLFDGGDSGTVTPSAGAEAVLYGETITSYAGSSYSIDGLHDVDGDGFDELLVGARGTDRVGSDNGAAYVIHGPVSGAMNLGQSDTGIYSTAGGAFFGYGLNDVGDTDGDGLSDLLVGDHGYGRVFLFSGAGI